MTFVRRSEGDRVALVAASLAVASPTLTYYSRFNSHDILVAVFTVLMIVLPFEYQRTGRLRDLLGLAAAVALAVSTKLNAWFSVAAVAAYFLGHAVYSRVRVRNPDSPPRVAIRPGHLPAAGLVAAAVVTLLYGTTFVYYLRGNPRFLIWAIRKTLGSVALYGFRYWAGIHATPRLGGPFHYYLTLLVMYEPAIVVMAIGALILYMRHRIQFGAALVAILMTEAMAISVFHPNLLASPLRMQPWHLMLASSVALAGAWTVVSLWTVGRTALGCWLFFGVAQLLLYSYAGEKVPWLTVHVLLPWLVVCSAFILDFWHALTSSRGKRTCATVGVALAILTVRTSWVLNTKNRSNVAEPMLQLEYTDAVWQTVQEVRDLAARSNEPVTVRIEPFAQWPFAWYLRDARPAYGDPLTSHETAPFLLGADGPVDPILATRYGRTKRPLLHWSTWIVNVGQGDIVGMLRFMIVHDRWGREESRPFVVWSRRDGTRPIPDRNGSEDPRLAPPATSGSNRGEPQP
jgi:uncharacterized protein (TIGR03663 family)